MCTFVSLYSHVAGREEIVEQKFHLFSGLFITHGYVKHVDLVAKKGLYFCTDSNKGHTDTSILFKVLT